MKKLLLAVLPLALAGAPPAAAHGPLPAPAVEQPAKGLVYRGLEATSVGPCAGGYKVVSTSGCTHGPDPAPPGLDVRVRPAVRTFAPSAAAPRVQCVGAGSAGKRVQVLYVRPSNVPDQYAAVKASIAGWATDADGIFRDSAAQTGGNRRIRFVHDAACDLIIDNVVIGPVADNNLALTSIAVAAQGYNRTDRKYLMFVDSNVYCGVGSLLYNDAPTNNPNDGGPSYSRVDAGCWSGTTAAHELMHNLGGVQLSAPNTSLGGHCVDEWDRMCYSDRPLFPAMQFPCALSEKDLFDCNKDDYFNTAPPANSYLDLNWNTADSGYLTR